ncbi:GNAT family N-acetyltransferase [Chitinophaga sp. YR627]|uniref:GNAT family N-acetyltransferase n=1 Tax=Chitinophaga sp. YR627 TaxID=1881041 RepID=UPI000B7CEFF0|nr:GNAT family N-acetyltransferase [Chitinophaga sp. YR627]
MLAEHIQLTDYTAIWKAACMEAFVSNVPDYFTSAEIVQFEDWLDKMSEERMYWHYYVVLSEDSLIGCGGFVYEEKLSRVTFAWGLVHRNFHKQGMGKLLLQYRLDRIRTLYPGADIILDTTQFSYTFFEQYGFVTVKYTEDGYTTGMHRYDMILYAGK